MWCVRERSGRGTHGPDADRYARSDADRAVGDERTSDRDREKQADRERDRASDRGRDRGDKDCTSSGAGGVRDRNRKTDRSRDRERSSQRGDRGGSGAEKEQRNGEPDKDRADQTREQDWELSGHSRDRAGKDSKVKINTFLIIVSWSVDRAGGTDKEQWNGEQDKNCTDQTGEQDWELSGHSRDRASKDRKVNGSSKPINQ